METWVITGASRGIGLELTRQALAAGHAVIACSRDSGAAGELAALESPELELFDMDVRDTSDVEGLAEHLASRAVDVLVNNAGVHGGAEQSVDSMYYDGWRDAFEVNTIAPFRITVALRDALLRSSRPRVMFISSQMASLSRRSTGSFAYRSTKAAANKVAQVLALEFEQDGIVVCPVHPGWVRTEMGGPIADISAEESASGLLELAERLSPEMSGRFWTWQGEEHPW